MNKIYAKFKSLSPCQQIAISFLVLIFIGAVLLSMPFSNRDNHWQNFIDALFTSTSATCVTGLSVNSTLFEYSPLGQLIILILIQVGGLGLMGLVAIFLLILKSRLNLEKKIDMQELLSQSYVSNSKAFLMGIFRYTMYFEIFGAFCLSFVFIPDFGLWSGIWKSIFISVSAFCNAGFDVLGTSSLSAYATNPLLNFVVIFLCTCGGLGFMVWFDVRGRLKQVFSRKLTFKKACSNLSLHTKLVLITTIIMIFLPAFFFLLIEYNNAKTIGQFGFFEKIQAVIFESSILRTTGFFTFDNGELHNASKFIAMICMFIGGSPGSMAGGIKTTTIAVIIACVITRLKGKNKTDVFGKHFPKAVIVQVAMILVANVLVLFIGIFFLLITENFEFEQICFEAVSALATVGLSTGITPNLSVDGKIIIILLMFIGKIGIITSLMSLRTAKIDKDREEIPEGHIMVG